MIKIVIVDDHQMFLDGMTALLSKQPDMEVLFVENAAKSALKRMQSLTPDLVITDISMPEMNGLEFIKALRKDHPDIKILAVSMFRNLEHLQAVDGFLLKETDNAELLKAIDSIVNHNQKYFKDTRAKTSSLTFNKSILSKREKEIIELIAEEYTTEEIAQKLIISKHTIEAHRKNIFLKLQVKNIAGLIKKAIYLGVIK